jgi:hypothetical protein
VISKGKGKIYPRTDHEGQEGESKYICTLSLTSELEETGGQLHAPVALPRKRDPLLVIEVAGWTPGLV